MSLPRICSDWSRQVNGGPTATSRQQLCSRAGGSLLIPWVPPFRFKEDVSWQMAVGRWAGSNQAGSGSGQGSSSLGEL